MLYSIYIYIYIKCTAFRISDHGVSDSNLLQSSMLHVGSSLNSGAFFGSSFKAAGAKRGP